MSILTGERIKQCVKDGSISIEPFKEGLVQPNSVDLTLGDEVRVYQEFVSLKNPQGTDSYNVSRGMQAVVLPPEQEYDRLLVEGVGPLWGNPEPPVLDAKRDNVSLSFKMDSSGWMVKPGILYLMHTAEVLNSNVFVTQLNGKSSLARLGIIIHFTAGYGDVGFKGQYTLEVSGIHPVRIYPGMKVAQAVFYTTDGPVTEYSGNYVGETARGAQPSRSWKQF